MSLFEVCDPRDIETLSLVSKDFYSVWKHFKERICKYHLSKYKVDYTNPGSFTSVMGGKGDYFHHLKVYLDSYSYPKIQCSFSKITSFPVYPNLFLKAAQKIPLEEQSVLQDVSEAVTREVKVQVRLN